MREITPNDIIGQRVKRVLETIGTTEDDITVNRAFVVLENGLAFEMFGPDKDADPILAIDPRELDATQAKPSALASQAEGKRILRVVESPYWASFGLLLEGQNFLYQDFHFKSLKAFVTPADRVDFDEMVDYWQRKPVSRTDTESQ